MVKKNRFMETRTHGLWTVLALFLAAGSLHGGLMAPQSVVALQQTADLIVNASSAQVVQNGSTVVTFSLNVIRVIKGDPSLVGVSIGASWAGGRQSVAPTSSASGIWFLRKAGGSWQVIPVVQGAMQLSAVYFPAPANLLSAYAYGQSATLREILASELASAVESNDGYNFSLYSLQSGLLDDLQSPIIELLYERMATSANLDNQLLGLSGLIRSGNASALTSAIQKAPAAPSGDPAIGILLRSIRDDFRATSANSVAVLGVAATSSSNPNSTFREAAGHALAAIHTSATLPFLATLLDDSDLNLRVEAVGGMGAFANGLPTQTKASVASLSYLQLPAGAPYKTDATVANLAFGVQAITRNQASYLSFWKSWWSQNRASLGY